MNQLTKGDYEMQWTWHGRAGHFVAANKCRFHLHTHVSKYCISTVGEYFPYGWDGEMETMNAYNYYETYLNDYNPKKEIIEKHGIKITYTDTLEQAEKAHIDMCHKAELLLNAKEEIICIQNLKAVLN